MSSAHGPRSREQILQERAFQQVSDVLQQLDWTLDRARKGHRIVAKDDYEPNVQFALADLINDLSRLRTRFKQDTMYAVEDRLPVQVSGRAGPRQKG